RAGETHILSLHDALPIWNVWRGCDSSGPVAEVLPGSRRQTAVASQAYGLWRSLVARLLWEQEVVGSSPTSPTTESTRRAGPIKWNPAAGVAQWQSSSLPSWRSGFDAL